MKKLFNPVIPNYTPRNTKEEEALTFKPCCVCQKQIITGYYGRHAEGGTCSKKCELNFKPKELHRENFSPATAFGGTIYSPR